MKPLLQLALPLIVVNLGQQMMAVVDTALAGRLDEVSLAATGLGSTLFFLTSIFGIGVTLGVDPIASQAFGAGRRRHARRAMWQGVYAGLVVTVPIAAATVGLGAILEWLGVQPALAEKTRLYLHARLASIIPLMVFMACRSYLQAAQLTRPIVISTVAANLFNLAADWILVFGDDGLVRLGLPELGIPALGVAGIGWATTVAATMQLAVVALALGAEPGQGRQPVRALDRLLLRRIFKLGIPTGLQLVSEGGIFALVSFLAGVMGSRAMAAHQVAIMLASLSFMVPLAVGMATSVQVGRAIGRADHPGTRRAGLAGIFLGGLAMIFAALMMWVFPTGLARIMTDQPGVVELSAQLLIIAGAFQIFDGIQAVASGALRGAGMTRWAMTANIVAYWLIGLPISLWLGFGLDWGPQGLWWGLTAGLFVAAAALSVKFAAVSRRPIAPIESDQSLTPSRKVAKHAK
ncbi:MAG: MATE family efflux transporter [Acidobacteriota bacterium]